MKTLLFLLIAVSFFGNCGATSSNAQKQAALNTADTWILEAKVTGPVTFKIGNKEFKTEIVATIVIGRTINIIVPKIEKSSYGLVKTEKYSCWIGKYSGKLYVIPGEANMSIEGGIKLYEKDLFTDKVRDATYNVTGSLVCSDESEVDIMLLRAEAKS